jgi:transposase
VTADPALRETLRDLALKAIVTKAKNYRISGELSDPAIAAKATLRTLARRWVHLSIEIDELDVALETLVSAACPPQLLGECGIGTDSAGALLVAAAANSERISTEAGFAALCGVSPVDASSGKQRRHHLNRGGDRQANNALWRIVFCRLTHHQPTRDYLERRTGEGMPKAEVIRCLKRYLARHIYRILIQSSPRPAPAPQSTAA